jgi:hypothetical protein
VLLLGAHELFVVTDEPALSELLEELSALVEELSELGEELSVVLVSPLVLALLVVACCEAVEVPVADEEVATLARLRSLADSAGSWPEASCTKTTVKAAMKTLTARTATARRMRLVRFRLAATLACAAGFMLAPFVGLQSVAQRLARALGHP